VIELIVARDRGALRHDPRSPYVYDEEKEEEEEEEEVQEEEVQEEEQEEERGKEDEEHMR
jgi:hypothetical protein